MGMWLVGQCSKTLKFGLKIPGELRLCRYFEDRLIWEPRMKMVNIQNIITNIRNENNINSQHNVPILNILGNLKVSVLNVRGPVGIWGNGVSYRYDRGEAKCCFDVV